MHDILSTLAVITSGMLFGAMVFFPSVVAPNVFRALDEDAGGAFLRRLFPAYYIFIIVLSGLTAVFAISRPIIAVGFAIVAISTVLVRQMLVPRLNEWRDQAKAGDQSAQKRFDGGHRFSVIVNLTQMVFVLIALWFLAS